MNEKIKNAETHQFRAVFPTHLNANGTLFGGCALQWMDEVAFITATRFTRQHMFTVSSENIRFLKAVNPDQIIELIGQVEKVEPARLKVKVEIFAEELYGQKREKVMDGIFVFACLNEQKRPIRINCNSINN